MDSRNRHERRTRWTRRALDSFADGPVGADAFGLLLHCHQHIEERLDVLETVARSLQEEACFTEHHLASLGDVIAFLDAAIPIHTADEENTLFPLLRRHPEFQTAASTPMDTVELQHRSHRAMRRSLDVGIVHRDPKATTNAALRMVVDYRHHMACEEEILYPVARKLLADQAVIDWMTEEMRARRRAAGLLDT
jgi:iron-sulfur cluster repair protein YtfE (RIC family)